MVRGRNGTGAQWDGGNSWTGTQWDEGAMGQERNGMEKQWDRGTVGQGRYGTGAHKDGPTTSVPVVVDIWKRSHICVWRRLYRVDDNKILSDHKFRLVDLNAVRLIADFNICLQYITFKVPP